MSCKNHPVATSLKLNYAIASSWSSKEIKTTKWTKRRSVELLRISASQVSSRPSSSRLRFIKIESCHLLADLLRFRPRQLTSLTSSSQAHQCNVQGVELVARPPRSRPTAKKVAVTAMTLSPTTSSSDSPHGEKQVAQIKRMVTLA